MANPRVFMVERNQRYDLSALEQKDRTGKVVGYTYGPVKYLTDRFNPFDTVGAVKTLNEAFDKAGYDPNNDMICMTGQALKVAQMLSVASTRYASIKILLFNAVDSTYELRVWSTLTPAGVADEHQ